MSEKGKRERPQSERERRLRRRLERDTLRMPVIGMESEFNVWLDEVEINPEPYWKHPKAFIEGPLLHREKTSSHIPTGGAVYFDRGVIEVVTPVIELAPQATARMVRNLWEQIQFVRDQLTNWEQKTGHTVRLKAYSSHYNITYEVPKSKQTASRNEKKLAWLLAHILPIPMMLVGANRRSTGIGVRPRGGRIEVTSDFTPDPGLMVATATLVVGIVRDVISWPSYDLSLLRDLPIPIIDGVTPGKHTTRKGWLTKDFHYPQSPFTADIDAPIWTTQFGDKRSLRQIGRQTAWFFRHSIRRYSDPFSFRLLFAVLEGRATSMLELEDRPKAYEDVGRLCRWGMVIDELRNFDAFQEHAASSEYVQERHRARLAEAPQRDLKSAAMQPLVAIAPAQPAQRSAVPRVPPLYLDRRDMSLLEKPARERRKRPERRRKQFTVPFPDRRLTRSAYEQVFLKLVSGGRLRVGKDLYTPVGMKGWYHAIFRRESDGSEKLLTIDQLLRKMNDWTT
ncbi:MAG TPA: hypothetical protein VGR95_06685 [Thermoanaerobaculia bacterium]|jgi:hypothetical protein|nr:hypothetical protein [Thermoanaerobaculia bacterium]